MKLGDIAEDTITGFSGVVVCIAEWLHGCRRVTLQPRGMTEDGKVREMATFDEPQLICREASAFEAGSREAGGPRPAPSRHPGPAR